MPKNAIACRTSIRRFERANYQLIEQLNFVQNRIFEEKKRYQVQDQCTKIVHTQCKLVHTQCKIVHTQSVCTQYRFTEVPVPIRFFYS